MATANGLAMNVMDDQGSPLPMGSAVAAGAGACGAAGLSLVAPAEAGKDLRLVHRAVTGSLTSSELRVYRRDMGVWCHETVAAQSEGHEGGDGTGFTHGPPDVEVDGTGARGLRAGRPRGLVRGGGPVQGGLPMRRVVASLPWVVASVLVVALACGGGASAGDGSIGLDGPPDATTDTAAGPEEDTGGIVDATTDLEPDRTEVWTESPPEPPPEPFAEPMPEPAPEAGAGDVVDGASDPGAGDSGGEAGDAATAEVAEGAVDEAAGDAPDGAAAEVTPDAPVGPEPLFDLAAIRDPSTANCTFTNARIVLEGLSIVEVFDVSFTSWEWVGGERKPILIRGFAARPAGGSGLMPGVVLAHGLGGFAEEGHATSLAARLGMFVLAYTGPGGGNAPNNTSEGLPPSADGGLRMFDTVPDARGSWFYGHAVAAMRAMTCLETRPDVDGARLGVTGFSAGGVVSLMAAGVDDRVKAAVPLSGTGAWGVAVQSPGAWQHALLDNAGLDTGSERWTTLLSTIGADVLVAGTKAAILMVDGTTDEFFPLTAFNATWDAIPGNDKRISLVANFDHGCYSLTGLEPASDIEARASLHASGGQLMWFSHWFGTDKAFDGLPLSPQVQVSAVGGGTLVVAVVDEAGYEVDDVRFWWSGDDCMTFAGIALDDSGGIWSAILPVALPANAVSYVDVTYRTKGLFSQDRFALSSRPQVPTGLVPRIRDIKTCL